MDICKIKEDVLVNRHSLMIQALRLREQDIFRYLAILVPSIGGYLWLVQNYHDNVFLLKSGTIGVTLLLLLGSFYSAALSFNYRNVIFQIALIERELDILKFVPKHWPRLLEDFKRYTLFKHIPWCSPPEMIKVFWISFIVGMIGVVYSTYRIIRDCDKHTSGLDFNLICLLMILMGCITPIIYGFKFNNIVDKELEEPDTEGG